MIFRGDTHPPNPQRMNWELKIEEKEKLENPLNPCRKERINNLNHMTDKFEIQPCTCTQSCTQTLLHFVLLQRRLGLT